MTSQLPEQNTTSLPDADWRTVLDSLPADKNTLPAVVLPDDLRSHARQSGESFEARWVMKNEKGQVFSVYAQLDRLKLREDANSQSLWSYNSVARALVATGGSDDTGLEVSEVFSRVALGLADSRGTDFMVGSTSLSLEQNDSCQRRINFSHTANAESSFALSAESFRCPQSASLGTINQWEFAGIPAQGALAGESVTGNLWLTHRWGSPANLQGRVVLDQLRLVIHDDQETPLWLNITRSKRRNGRGPKTVLATASDAQGAQRDVMIDWIDNGEVVSTISGNVYPQTIRIQDHSMGLDLVLLPLVELSELYDSLQMRWSGALDVSGSHTGMAYLDFIPVSSTKE